MEPLLREVEQHLGIGEFDDALARAEEALSLARELKDGDAEVAALHHVVDAYLGQGRLEAVEAFVAGEIAAFQESGNVVGEAAMLLTVAEIRSATSGPKEALKAAREALAIFREAGRDHEAADALRVIATLLWGTSELVPAALAAEEAARLLRKLGDVKGEAVAHEQLATLHLAKDDPRRAMEAGARALRLLTELGERKGEMALLSVAIRLVGAGRQVEGFKTLSEAVVRPELQYLAGRVAIHSPHLKCLVERAEQQAAHLSIAAASLQSLGLLADALLVASEAAERWRACGASRQSLGRTLDFMANVHLAVLEGAGARPGAEARRTAEDTRWHRGKAMGAALEAVAALEGLLEPEAKLDKGMAFNTLAKAHLQAEDVPGALGAAERAITTFEALEHLGGVAVATHTVATVRLADGDLDAAQRAASTALELFQEVGDDAGQATAQALCDTILQQRAGGLRG